ncbi:MAG: hypothetical protein PVI33_01980 [Candidatus Omnitrophota bacterium]|jgi:hypothetical protein
MKRVIFLAIAVFIVFFVFNLAYGQDKEIIQELNEAIVEEQAQEVKEEQSQEVTAEQTESAEQKQIDEAQGPILVLYEAKERTKSAVAVEAYLIDDIFEVTVIAKMYGTKPLIHKVLVVGPKLGRLSPHERQTVYPKAEDQEAFYKTKDIEGGIIRLKKREKEKKLKQGALTKELARFKIPTDKIVENKRYQLWVKIESMQRGGRFESFKFELKDFPKLFSQ